MGKQEYFYIQVQLVGNLENYARAYYSDLQKFKTAKAAYNHGVKVLEHDDFLIGKFEDNRVIDLVASNGKTLNDTEGIEEVNAEFCFSPPTNQEP